jgi:DNA-binding response OmpR family regulator
MPTEQRKKILIIDDEKLTRSLLQRNVVLAGYDAIVASNGKEALEKIEDITPDLIVVDLVMPDMNGFETCRRIRSNERTMKTPVIVVSALQSQSDVEDAKNSGADVFLTKPIRPEEFINHVKKFLPSPFKTVP